MLTQQSDSYLMESFPQVCMQSAVLGMQSFFNKHPHDMVKGLGLLILGCLSLCENQFTSLVFFACNFFPKMMFLYQCKCWLVNWPWYTESKEKLKKEADHSRLQVAALISKGAYLQGLSWAAIRQVDLLISHPPANILKVYIEAITGFSPSE